MTCEFAGAEEVYAHGHEILSAIYAVVTSKVASMAGHHVDLTHAIAGIGVKSLEQNGVVALAPTGIGVEGKDYSVLLVRSHELGYGMWTVVGRIQAVHISIHDDGRETSVVLYGFLAIGQVLFAHVAQFDVEAHLAHHGHVCAEFHSCARIPSGNMGAGGLGGIEERVGILDEETLQGVGVVACPELGEVGERLVVNTSATSGTKHHGKVGVLGLDALQYVIESAYIIYIQMGLLVLEVVRVDVGDGAVTVPLEIGNAGIVCHEAIHYTEHEVLHLWVAKLLSNILTLVQ